MAVQKSRVTPSRRGMRRSHDHLRKAVLTVDATTGETHRRHHISPEGYYKGREIISKPEEAAEEEEKE